MSIGFCPSVIMIVLLLLDIVLWSLRRLGRCYDKSDVVSRNMARGLSLKFGNLDGYFSTSLVDGWLTQHPSVTYFVNSFCYCRL